MSQPSEAPGKTRPRFTERFALLVDRIALRLATSRRVDGLWIGFGGSTRSELVLQRVEEALHLIKKYDLVRYNRLIRDLDRVWVTMLSGPAGCFDRSIAACKLDQRFVLADTSSPEVIASVIVHEAAHARLQRCGIGYEEDLRGRVEAVCIRRQLAFAAKLPMGNTSATRQRNIWKGARIGAIGPIHRSVNGSSRAISRLCTILGFPTGLCEPSWPFVRST
jgi:hypothetical protein